jgi:hypothetical protein
MSRFYFHFRGTALIPDDSGEEFPDTKAAMQHARRMATELAEEPGLRNSAIIVSDGQQNLAEVVVVELAQH